jgi:signal transduction histidine kinase/ligand-binding sensor domain-containing protein/DNA-binding response OmpR family regulator
MNDLLLSRVGLTSLQIQINGLSLPYFYYKYMNRTRHFITALCILLFTCKVTAQPFTMKHLSVEDGLSNNYVLDMAQDGQGFIWVATMSGLNRFDGRNFTVYKENNSKLVNNAVNTLLYDSEDNMLWIGTRDGVCLFNCSTRQFENFSSSNDVEVKNVVHFSQATDGGIWMTGHSDAIIHFDKKTKKCTPLPQGKNKTNLCTCDMGNGQLFVGHAQNGLTVIDRENNTSKNYLHDPKNPKSLPGNSVYSVCIDRAGNIWVGTNQGLALFNAQTEEFLVFRHEPANPHSLIADHIYNLQEMEDGRLWIAADIGGVSILDLHNISFMNPDAARFINISADADKSGLSSGNTRSLLQDSFGNIWIGNYSSGLDFISHTQPAFHILPYINLQGSKNEPVWGIWADNDGQVWLGGENEIVVFKDGKLKKRYDITPYLTRPYGQVFSIQGNAVGALLLGIYDDGLLKHDTRNDRIERIPLDMEHIDIITFFEDADGRIWIGTEYGIYSCNNEIIHKKTDLDSQLPDKSVYGILRDRQGKLWIGTYAGGIAILDSADKLTARLSTDNGFCSNSISQLYMDSQGSVWATTLNGIAYIKDTNHPEQFELYNDKHGLEENYVRAIQEDKAGNILISTNSGISFWDKEKQKFDNYDHRDGVPVGNFIEGSACITSDGAIYFGSLNGVCYFNPAEISVNRQVAPVQILECKGFNRQTESRSEEFPIPSADGNINLRYRQNSFRISFSVPDYSQNQQVEYAYMMEGLDDVWYSTQGENHITFRNISPGEYTFKVKARLKNRDWDESHITTMNVNIHPPLWLAWYAKLFYALILGLGIYAWLRFYKRKLNLETSLELEKRNSRNEQELNQERLRFYTNITHELRTPLTLILGPLEDLLHDSDLPSLYSGKIKTIHGSAIRLLNLINQILEFRKTETQNRRLTVARGDLKNLVTEIGLRYQELSRNDKVKFHIAIETEATMLYFDADIIATVLNNLLSNAVKYTPEGEIGLTLSAVEEHGDRFTEIRVSDTGHGINAQDLPRIFDRYFQAKGKHQASGTGIGLALVKSLADLHHGTLHVESAEGEGTAFKFRILTDNTYPDALHKEAEKQLPAPETDKKEEDADSRAVILVVEDNDDIREYIVSSFTSNYRVTTAANGKDGLATAQKDIPDIIVSDIMMPVMDGIEFCRAVKEDIRTSHIPVILLTAKDSIRDKEEGYESGADSYLTKPFSAKLLRSRIQNLLESRRKLARQITDRTRKIKPEKGEAPLKISKLDEEFLLKLTRIIEENRDMERLDIAFLSKKMNMSHSTFYRKVKGLTGISANEFIRKVRLKNSLQLLSSGKYNVSEAAYATGFNDLAYFRECFKEEYGMTPTEYLKAK